MFVRWGSLVLSLKMLQLIQLTVWYVFVRTSLTISGTLHRNSSGFLIFLQLGFVLYCRYLL